jgi:glycosyltransferase involved in cell wall biosynthesis
MRIVMMGLWPDKGRVTGGVSNTILNQVREIGRSKEPEFYFVSFSPSGGTLSEGHAKIVLIRRRRIYYACPFLAVLSVWLAVRRLKPDVIHVQGGNLSPYLVYALFFARQERKVVTFHQCGSKELVARGLIKRTSLHHALLRWLEKQTARRADLITAVTSQLAEQIHLLDESAKEKTIVLPNGVDPDVFSPKISGEYARKQLGLSRTDFMIFHAKAFRPFNGQSYLIKALPEVLSETPDAKLVLAGAGPLLLEAQTLSAQLTLSDKVIFPGHVPHDQIPSYMAAADIVIVPSIRMDTMEEGSSNLLVEAMATQKPVVATDVGGNRDSITHEENGLLIPDKDPHAIAKSILRLYHDRAFAEKIGGNALEYVMTERTWKENANRIRAAYERLTLQE